MARPGFCVACGRPLHDGDRLLVRWQAGGARNRPGPPRTAVAGAVAVKGPGPAFERLGSRSVVWTARVGGGLDVTTTFTLHPRLAAWAWRIHIRNGSRTRRQIDALHAQDLGLAD